MARTATNSKKSASKPKPAPLSATEKRKLYRKAAQKELRDELDDELEDELEDDLEDDFDEFEEDSDESGETLALSESSGEDEINSQDAGFDIFEYGSNLSKKSGVPVFYFIHKNGAVLGRKDAPYSFELLQSEHGGGYYKIFLKNMSNGQIMKQSTRQILDDPKRKALEAQAEAQKQASLSPAELLALIDSKAREAKEEARAESKTGDNIMIALMSMMQQSQQSVTQMIQESNKMQMLMFEKMNDNTNRMMEKFQAQMAQISMQKQTGEKQLSTFEMIKLLQDAESKGVAQYTNIMKLAEVKAEEKAELIAQIQAASSSNEEKPSMVESLLKTLLPVIAAQVQNNPALLASLAQPTPQAPQSAPSNVTVLAPRETPRVPKSEPKVMRGKAVKPTTQTNSNGQNTASNTATTSGETVLKDKIKEVLTPHVLSSLQASTAPQAAAQVVPSLLKAQGITTEAFLSAYKLDDLVALRGQYAIPEGLIPAVDAWLKEFYAAIEVSQKAASDQSHTG